MRAKTNNVANNTTTIQLASLDNATIATQLDALLTTLLRTQLATTQSTTLFAAY